MKGIPARRFGEPEELIGADQLGFIRLAATQGDLDDIGVIDHMVVGDDIAGLIDDKPGTQASLFEIP